MSRPFSDLHGAKKWLLERTAKIRNAPFDPDMERETYRNETLDLARLGLQHTRVRPLDASRKHRQQHRYHLSADGLMAC